LLAGTAWGRTTISSEATSVEILGGSFRLAVISIPVRRQGGSTDGPELRLDGQPVQVDVADGPDRIEVRPRAALDLRAGSCLELVR
jgi:hypothetical protein